MTEYRDYTIEITLKSPIITHFQSDTIFGHICWAIRFLYQNGENKLREFLETYDKEENPPLLVSNGFPSGYLPKPVIPSITQTELDKFVGKENRIANSFKIKTIKKLTIISKSDFEQLQTGAITPLSLFQNMYGSYATIMGNLANEQSEQYEQSMAVQHNTVNRIKGKVTRGLYAQEETFFGLNAGNFVIYLKTYCFSRKELEGIFAFIGEGGFGRDKSTGKGYFNTVKVNEGIDLREANNPNAFMTLSSFIPRENNPVRGYYHTLLKYGKLGGLYATGASEVNNNPFKKPLIMFSAGSVFYDTEYRTGKPYGALLDDVHHNNKGIRHYAHAFPIGINLKVEDIYEDFQIAVRNIVPTTHRHRERDRTA